MKALKFKEANVAIAESQDEYQTLYAHKDGQPEDLTTTCWQLSPEEIQQVNKTGCIWIQQLMFRKPYPPIYMSLLKPSEFTQPETDKHTSSDSKPDIQLKDGKPAILITQDELTSALNQHYKQQLIKDIQKFCKSIDIELTEDFIINHITK